MKRLADQMRAWYTTPTGLAFGVGLVLIGAGIALSGPWRTVGVAGVAIVAVAIPRRFLHQQVRMQDIEHGLERIPATEARIDELDGARTRHVERLDRLDTRITSLRADLQKRDDRATAATSAIAGRIDDAEAAHQLTAERLLRVTGAASEIHDRDVTPEQMRGLIDYWGPLLDLELDARHLQAWLHRVRAFETLAVGRIATNLEDIIIRSLAARAVARPTTEMCEIGTLFGIGGLVVRDAIAPFTDEAKLTIIDPLAGYYGPDRADPPTGLVVDRRTLDRNIALFSPGENAVRVLEGYSTDDTIREAASDRSYDLLIIDGDHSYDGVRLDFERYADLVRTDGILIVDDYGAAAWPEVTQFTDDVVMHDPRFTLIGASSRTALFRRN